MNEICHAYIASTYFEQIAHQTQTKHIKLERLYQFDDLGLNLLHKKWLVNDKTYSKTQYD